jgi:hypothetical protein
MLQAKIDEMFLDKIAVSMSALSILHLTSIRTFWRLDARFVLSLPILSSHSCLDARQQGPRKGLCNSFVDAYFRNQSLTALSQYRRIFVSLAI